MLILGKIKTLREKANSSVIEEDAIMDLQFKKYVLSSLLGSTILISANIQAAPLVSNEFQQPLNENNASFMLFIPEMELEGTAQSVQGKSIHLISNAYTQPLLPKLDNQMARSACKAQKKNDLYEISAIFNDKLQSIISYFEDEPVTEIAEKLENKDDLDINSNVAL